MWAMVPEAAPAKRVDLHAIEPAGRGWDGHRGCLKVNLQVLDSNGPVADFYRRLGYALEPRISMGRRLGKAPGS